MPPEVYTTLETLLPTAAPNNSFLELWGQHSVRRSGWTHVVEVADGGGEVHEGTR